MTLSDSITAVSGTKFVSHVSKKQRMFQSLMSRWNVIMALRLSNLFSKDWTLASRMLCFLPRCLRGLLEFFSLFLSMFQIISDGHDGLEVNCFETGQCSGFQYSKVFLCHKWSLQMLCVQRGKARVSKKVNKSAI